ncbi:hypothetical protein AXF42_Ash005697 [Apostasia shenzhenica]|uniref:PSI domain-containing protein n=1 Tax=Apostasia shenzhenica TaxID=1088818 RepID=A0A2I0BC37_9ASPA|nr:hypothetical protein AXF42_Ash005697 [Apostasia shenzhenica]
MAANTGIRLPLSFFLFSLLLAYRQIPISTLAGGSDSAGGHPRPRDLLGYVPSTTKEGGAPAAPNCTDIASMDPCLRHSKRCRWCRSEVLDDMCVGSAEAWRLPHQSICNQTTEKIAAPALDSEGKKREQHNFALRHLPLIDNGREEFSQVSLTIEYFAKNSDRFGGELLYL